MDDGAEANPPAGISAGSGGGWWRWLSLAALPALAVAVYAPAWRGGFIWDDLLLVRQNPLVTGEFTFSKLREQPHGGLFDEFVFGKGAGTYSIKYPSNT